MQKAQAHPALHPQILITTSVCYHRKYTFSLCFPQYFPGGPVIENRPANAEDTGLIPDLRRSPGEMATHSSILTWKIPRSEEPGGLRPMGTHRDGQDLATEQL